METNEEIDRRCAICFDYYTKKNPKFKMKCCSFHSHEHCLQKAGSSSCCPHCRKRFLTIDDVFFVILLFAFMYLYIGIFATLVGHICKNDDINNNGRCSGSVKNSSDLFIAGCISLISGLIIMSLMCNFAIKNESEYDDYKNERTTSTTRTATKQHQ